MLLNDRSRSYTYPTGPFDSSKLATVVNRSEQSLQRSINYMRAPDSLRGDYKFSNAVSRLPPMAHIAIAAELEALSVPNHCAEGEADSPTAELAERRNGYVLSNDSDFFIYPARCRGYVPLNTVTYGPTNAPRLEKVSSVDPPAMQFLVYQPAAIAHSFSLPLAFLPVLAALIGNDVANYADEINGDRGSKAKRWPGRVDPRELRRLAGALSTCAAMPTETLPQTQDVVFTVLPRLMSQPSKDPLIVANLATAAWSYRLESLDAPHPSYPLHPCATDSPAQAAARAQYNIAYRASRLSSFTLHLLKHGTVLLQGSVEQPEYQSPVVSLAAPIRRWVYAVLRETLGERAVTGAGMPEVIYEYARRGEALLPAQVPVPKLQDLLVGQQAIDPTPYLSAPLLGLPRAQRFALVAAAVSFPHFDHLLAALASQPHLAHYLPLLLALHHIQLTHATKRPWTSSELVAAILVAVVLHRAPGSIPAIVSAARRGRPRLVAPRKTSIQRGVELVVTLVALNILAQVLLLPSPDAQDLEWTDPHYLYDGGALHALLELEEATLWTVVAGCPMEVQRDVQTVVAMLGQSLGVEAPLVG